MEEAVAAGRSVEIARKTKRYPPEQTDDAQKPFSQRVGTLDQSIIIDETLDRLRSLPSLTEPAMADRVDRK